MCSLGSSEGEAINENAKFGAWAFDLRSGIDVDVAAGPGGGIAARSHHRHSNEFSKVARCTGDRDRQNSGWSRYSPNDVGKRWRLRILRSPTRQVVNHDAPRWLSRRDATFD